MNYTYDDFLKKANSEGLYNQFSDADLKLAQSNPDVGMSILSYKMDYRDAPTDEARALANAGANKERADYGNYKGGDKGSRYYIEEPQPLTYEKPAYTDPYASNIQGQMDTILGRQPYQSSYSNTIDNQLNKLVNRKEFDYDTDTDVVYGAYKKQYGREGQRAMGDALGNISAATGGIPSSYAATAVGQAGDYYATKLTDKIPELAAQAYQRYLDDYGLNRDTLDAVRGVDDTKYQRYIDDIGMDYDALEALSKLSATDYGRYTDSTNFDYGQWLDNLNWDRERENIDRTQENYLDERNLDQSWREREWDRDDTRYNQEWTREESRYGDSKSQQEQALAMERALYAAEYLGNYGPLRKLLGL